MSKSAIDKLGKRLAKADVPAEEDVRLLFALQREYDEALRTCVAALPEIIFAAKLEDHDIEVTQRTKTKETLLDKVRRGSALSRIQDVAGARLVGPFLLPEQDRLARQLERQFPGARVEDRRMKTNHGYRAVHVVAAVDGFPVEIQVRTDWQHLWANATEFLADRWGRAIRYGGAPSGNTPDDIAQNTLVFAEWMNLSACIADLEMVQQQAFLEYWRRALTALASGISEATAAQAALDANPQHARALDDILTVIGRISHLEKDQIDASSTIVLLAEAMVGVRLSPARQRLDRALRAVLRRDRIGP